MALSTTHDLDKRPVVRLLEPFRRFAQMESASSLVLLFATLLAVGLANSPLAGPYEHALELPLGLRFGNLSFAWPLTEWVNDVLMAIFFLVVGLEVKRELLTGELASFRRAILPVLAALGGMVVPALVYIALNHGGPAQRGWGVPIATDIAFSLAILTAFGSRIPFALKIFLASLAIADDIGGVLVIAVAYTSKLHLVWLLASLGIFLLCLVLNRLGITPLWLYLLVGVGLWLTMHASGIHPTLAGILLAIAVPARSFVPAENFVEHSHRRLEAFRRAHIKEESAPEKREPLRDLEKGLTLVQSPLDRMEESLHPLVSYGIMPLFALVNAGISFHGFQVAAMLRPSFLGIVLGLLLGKPIGITAFSWLAVRLRLAELPAGVTWAHVHAASWVAGIGFTVAIFVAGLAFGVGVHYTDARIAILLASTTAAIAGAILLSLAPGNTQQLPTESEADHTAVITA